MREVTTSSPIVPKCQHCGELMDRYSITWNLATDEITYRCQNRFCPGRPVSEWVQAMRDFAHDLQTASPLYPKHAATFLEAAAELVGAAREIEAIETCS